MRLGVVLVLFGARVVIMCGADGMMGFLGCADPYSIHLYPPIPPLSFCDRRDRAHGARGRAPQAPQRGRPEIKSRLIDQKRKKNRFWFLCK